MKLQFTLDELSSLLVYLYLPLRLSRTVHMHMQNRALGFISSTRHFTASSILRANRHTKLDQAMLFTRQNLRASATLPLSGTVHSNMVSSYVILTYISYASTYICIVSIVSLVFYDYLVPLAYL